MDIKRGMRRRFERDTSAMELRICHLYPEIGSAPAERGNLVALIKRALWRGIDVRVAEVGLRHQPNFTEFDLVLFSAPADVGQPRVASDLIRYKARSLREAAGEGVVMLASGGGFQLFGRYYRTRDGLMPGAGVLDCWTEEADVEFQGEAAVRIQRDDLDTILVGRERHRGRTLLSPGCVPLGRVLLGHGNNGRDGGEGARRGNVFATYMHGSFLPKNPALIDHLFALALGRKYGGDVRLPALPGMLEDRAHQVTLRQMRPRLEGATAPPQA